MEDQSLEGRIKLLMRSVRVTFQGEHGAFSEAAARRFFGRQGTTVPVKSFEDVFTSVRGGSARYGVVPVENSLFGSIHQTYDLLQKFNLKIIGEIKLRIVHALMVNRGVTMSHVKVIYSHPQALGQCENYLHRLKGREVVAVYDTAGAAKMIKEEKRRDAAAIASLGAARVYGLTTLNVGIENDHQNFTRFLVLSRTSVQAPENAKTSIIFAMKNIPGALFQALGVFALRGIDLYRIESRPLIGKPWEYLFYLDFCGSATDAGCRDALAQLRTLVTYVKLLGSYPHGKTVGGARP